MNQLHSLRALALVLSALASTVSGTPAHAESLFDADTYRALESDAKARSVGDALTVQIVENSSATSSADTATHRKSDYDATAGKVTDPNSKGGGLQTSSDFDGGGKTLRSGRLIAQITVVVNKVTPVGDLLVSGDQLLTINGEDQKIHLEGRVRPADVSTANTVPSTRLADARITYVGVGDLADRTRPGWWARLLNWFGL
ncbi:flagellar basal body L-ring protein FlgH [Paraburkholderia ferrariae]|uniref:Flagellar L-ring protein n=1 Tax=Paraburkholderia ferrariae TaxID=386056 RepID=A0ABU9RMF8_9BURK